MEYNRLGKTGLKVSQLSFGSWVTFSFQLGVDDATKIMKLAFKAHRLIGCRIYQTAPNSRR